MSYKKGGRGKKAPYNTRTYRVPEPVLEEVKAVIDRFHKSLENGEYNPFGEFKNNDEESSDE